MYFSDGVIIILWVQWLGPFQLNFYYKITFLFIPTKFIFSIKPIKIKIVFKLKII